MINQEIREAIEDIKDLERNGNLGVSSNFVRERKRHLKLLINLAQAVLDAKVPPRNIFYKMLRDILGDNQATDEWLEKIYGGSIDKIPADCRLWQLKCSVALEMILNRFSQCDNSNCGKGAICNYCALKTDIERWKHNLFEGKGE